MAAAERETGEGMRVASGGVEVFLPTSDDQIVIGSGDGHAPAAVGTYKVTEYAVHLGVDYSF